VLLQNGCEIDLGDIIGTIHDDWKGIIPEHASGVTGGRQFRY